MPAELINGDVALSLYDVRYGVTTYPLRDGWDRLAEMDVLEAALADMYVREAALAANEYLHLLFSSPRS